MIDVPLRNGGFGSTARQDTWWLEPLVVFTGFAAFVVYSTWAALQGNHYTVAGTGYLSPFYSPLLLTVKPGWWPAFLPFSAAMLILWVPGGFPFTCYYYRGAYYKAFWQTLRRARWVSRGSVTGGERSFPLILQNVHRYFLYLALVFIVILALDVWRAIWFEGRFGIGIATLVLIVNPSLLACYRLGCHSLRHLVGGRLEEMSKAPLRKAGHDYLSCLNRRHMMWAWLSLFCVGFADIYIRLCSTGVWTDSRIL